jgi:hypothetical protein
MRDFIAVEASSNSDEAGFLESSPAHSNKGRTTANGKYDTQNAIKDPREQDIKAAA